jgi:hypothetical protein
MKRILLSFLIVLFGCTTAEDQTIDADEANTRIGIAIGLKNAQCGYGQFLTLPAIFPLREEAVTLCVSAIISTPCTTWAGNNPLSGACLALPFYRKKSRDNYGL